MADDNFEPELLTLEDEDGVSQTFEILDNLEDGENLYFALVPYVDDPSKSLEENSDLVILKIEDPSDPDSGLITIDDDEEYYRIGSIFLKRLENFYDGGDGDDEEFDGDDYDGEDGEE